MENDAVANPCCDQAKVNVLLWNFFFLLCVVARGCKDTEEVLKELKVA